MLILTENYAALSILQQQVLEEIDRDPVVIFGSSFPKDQQYTQVRIYNLRFDNCLCLCLSCVFWKKIFHNVLNNIHYEITAFWLVEKSAIFTIMQWRKNM